MLRSKSSCAAFLSGLLLVSTRAENQPLLQPQTPRNLCSPRTSTLLRAHPSVGCDVSSRRKLDSTMQVGRKIDPCRIRRESHVHEVLGGHTCHCVRNFPSSPDNSRPHRSTSGTLKRNVLRRALRTWFRSSLYLSCYHRPVVTPPAKDDVLGCAMSSPGHLANTPSIFTAVIAVQPGLAVRVPLPTSTQATITTGAPSRTQHTRAPERNTWARIEMSTFRQHPAHEWTQARMTRCEWTRVKPRVTTRCPNDGASNTCPARRRRRRLPFVLRSSFPSVGGRSKCDFRGRPLHFGQHLPKKTGWRRQKWRRNGKMENCR